MQQSVMKLVLVLSVAVLEPLRASLLRKTDVVPKKDVKIKNPMDGNSVGDLIPEQPKPDPKGQEYNHMYAPLSPSGREDLSDTDPVEYTDSWQGQSADMVDHISATTMRRFESTTCESVCAACSIYAAQQEEGLCECYSTCKLGDCGAGSGSLPHIGWSNNAVTTPRTLWEATCNIGEKNCEAQCMKKELKKQIKDCKDDKGSPVECFRKLRQLYLPLPLDSRKQVHWCTRKGMSTCDSFMNVPSDGGWLCYQYKDKCKEKLAVGFKIPIRSWQAPSVWKSVADARR